ncbi:hypothetical protein ACIQUG_34180 [Ensifer sp. NPDC090286]|uniref:hypothetical protein n=1 Tax=unclassified Ensifer TaxID=2633371 RepID=UPI0012E06023|nr:hypothetical protein [Ensifer sp. ZNC0028]
MAAQTEPAKAPADVSATTQGAKLSQSGGSASIEDVWLCAAESIPGSVRRMTSAHGDLYDINGLPK